MSENKTMKVISSQSTEPTGPSRKDFYSKIIQRYNGASEKKMNMVGVDDFRVGIKNIVKDSDTSTFLKLRATKNLRSQVEVNTRTPSEESVGDIYTDRARRFEANKVLTVNNRHHSKSSVGMNNEEPLIMRLFKSKVVTRHQSI